MICWMKKNKDKDMDIFLIIPLLVKVKNIFIKTKLVLFYLKLSGILIFS